MQLSEILKIPELKIELGAGKNPRMKQSTGWLLNDLQALPGIDLVAPCDNLGLPKMRVAKLYCSHLIEHIAWDLTYKVVSYWHSLLKSDGSLEILCPNCEYAMKKFLEYSAEDKIPPAMLYRVIWGTRDAGTNALPPYNTHHSGFTKNYLKKLLAQIGFINIAVTDYSRFGIKDRDIYAICYKQ